MRHSNNYYVHNIIYELSGRPQSSADNLEDGPGRPRHEQLHALDSLRLCIYPHNIFCTTGPHEAPPLGYRAHDGVQGGLQLSGREHFHLIVVAPDQRLVPHHHLGLPGGQVTIQLHPPGGLYPVYLQHRQAEQHVADRIPGDRVNQPDGAL